MNRGETTYKIAGGSGRQQWGRHLAQQRLSQPNPSDVHGGGQVSVGKRQRVLPSAAVVEGAVRPQ